MSLRVKGTFEVFDGNVFKAIHPPLKLNNPKYIALNDVENVVHGHTFRVLTSK